jgi:excisionase family DNA binding protein
MSDSPLITIKEAAEYLNISKDVVYLLARSKEFPAIKIGNSWRVLKKELDVWIAKQYKDKPTFVYSL